MVSSSCNLFFCIDFANITFLHIKNIGVGSMVVVRWSHLRKCDTCPFGYFLLSNDSILSN